MGETCETCRFFVNWDDLGMGITASHMGECNIKLPPFMPQARNVVRRADYCDLRQPHSTGAAKP